MTKRSIRIGGMICVLMMLAPAYLGANSIIKALCDPLPFSLCVRMEVC